MTRVRAQREKKKSWNEAGKIGSCSPCKRHCQQKDRVKTREHPSLLPLDIKTNQETLIPSIVDFVSLGSPSRSMWPKGTLYFTPPGDPSNPSYFRDACAPKFGEEKKLQTRAFFCTLFLFYFKTSIPQYELYHTFYIFIGRGSLYFSLLKQTKICLQIDIPERRDALQILFGGVRLLGMASPLPLELRILVTVKAKAISIRVYFALVPENYNISTL